MTQAQKSTYVADWLDRRAKLTPDRIALEEAATGRVITYRQWDESANRTANFLRQLGVRRGDRVAVYSGNCIEYLDVWMACGKTGAILQSLNWRLTVSELQVLLNDAAPLVLIYADEYVEQVNALRHTLPTVRHFIAFGEGADAEDIPFSQRDELEDTFDDPPELSPDDAWVICYTGGTTGVPKGAILTHRNMTWNSINTVVSWGLQADDVAILNAPLFHTGGLNVFTLPLIHVGGKSILCTGFDAGSVFDLIEGHKVTLYFGVPTMFIMMQQHERWADADFSGMKLVISGGAPCPLPVFERFWEKGVDFKTGYGLTEAGPNTFWLPTADVQRKPGAVGFPLFHVDVQVVNKQGWECSDDEPGELLIRGEHVSPGYWNNPKATVEAIRGGWLHTGDLAVRDADGCYSIVGRLKDMIISGGENIYPAEVESVIHEHPAVAGAALIGVPDAKWGEVGRAVIVVKRGKRLNEDTLIDFLGERLAKYKVPKSVVFVDELPMTGAGKIDKRRLVELYGA